MSRRRGLWRLLWLALTPVLAGCPGEQRQETAGALPFAGQEIRIGVPGELGFRTAWEGPLNEWGAQTGAKCSLNELPAREASAPFAALSADDHETIAFFPLEQAGELVGAGDLAPIPESLLKKADQGLPWHDLFAGLSGKLATKKGTALFVPLACPVLVCYYRHDLLTAAGRNPPQTWDEYQQLLETLDDWAPGLGAVEPWGPEFRATMFLARAVSFAQHPANYSLYFDIETGEPLIDSPAFVRALEASRQAVVRMPAAVLSHNPAVCRNAILSGKAALAIAFEAADSTASAGAAAAGTPIERPDSMTIGFIRLPGVREVYNPSRHAWEAPADKGIHQVTLCGFAGTAVGASSRNSKLQTEAGWNALIKVCGGDFASGIPPGIVGLCRESQLRDSISYVGSGLEGDEALACTEAVGQSLRDARLAADLPVTGRLAFRDALAQGLAGALNGSQTPQESLQNVARNWREIIGRLGAAKVRDSYRANLGLSPLSAPE